MHRVSVFIDERSDETIYPRTLRLVCRALRARNDRVIKRPPPLQRRGLFQKSVLDTGDAFDQLFLFLDIVLGCDGNLFHDG